MFFPGRNTHTHIYIYVYIYVYIYIYSHPEVDRILFFSKMFSFKKKIVGIFSKPSVFTRFSSLLSHV